MKLIVGLGNPGKQYENTRHNVGFLTLSQLAHKIKVDSFKSKFEGAVNLQQFDQFRYQVCQL